MIQIMIHEIKLDFFGKIILPFILETIFLFSRALLIQTDKCPTLSKHAKKILLAPKPAPILESIIRGEIILKKLNIGLILFRRS